MHSSPYPHAPMAAPTSSPPSRFRDHSPTKSSPLRHTVSTRSQTSDAGEASTIPGRHDILRGDATSGPFKHGNYVNSDALGDSGIARLGTKRDRSESPVKQKAAFAQWEQREQAEQAQQSRMDVSPKKIRDDDWRSGLGRAENRSALQPLAQNAAHEKFSTPTYTTSLDRRESKENLHFSASMSSTQHSPSPKPPSHTRGYSTNSAWASTSPDSQQGSSTNQPHFAGSRNSLATLSRADSIRASTRPARPTAHGRFASLENNTPHLDGADLDQLQKSSTPQLRHLSQLASEEGNAEDLSVHSAEEQVTGLFGRRKLQRSGSVKPTSKQQSQFASQYASTRWMDTQRRHLQAYEYLCHIGEARAWIEDVLEPNKLPPIVHLEEALRDGVTLAEIVVRLAPSLAPSQQRALGSQRIFRSERLQFRHSDNIALFFRFLAEVDLPELFRFELVDLYEKKNIPKVIYCIHALSWLLFRKEIVNFRIGNLLGQLQFAEHELEETQKGIDRSGVQMPNFGSMRQAMEVEEEPPPPEPSPDELLAQQEDMILDFQSQIRGVLVRLRLGATMQSLWDAEEQIAMFQSVARGGFAREIFKFRCSMDASTRRFQAAAKAYLVRERWRLRESVWARNQDAVTKIQSLWRAKQQRAETETIMIQLQQHKHGLKDLQAAVRGALGRWRAGDLWHEARDQQNEAAIITLQSAARGLIQRRRQELQHGEWRMHTSQIAQVQAASRGLLERLRQARTKGALQGRETVIAKVQSRLRGQAVRSRIANQKADLRKHSSSVTNLQAHIKAQALRREVDATHAGLLKNNDAVLRLQSLSRAMLLRRSIGQKLAKLEDQESNITTLQSLSRAYIERQRIYEQLVAMEQQEESILSLQAAIRSMLLRNHVGTLLAELEDCESSITEFEAAMRGFLVRQRFAEKRQHFRDNMQKVIKLQSFVRAKQQGESYKSLVNGKNPPLPVVRRHVHLLTDSHLEFEGEIEAERLRRQVVESVRRNELVESYVEGLDVKIALLVKNKITLDEVVKHQKHFGGSASQLLRSGSTHTPSTSLDLKALNKSSRKKLTGYEELFFMIQTQPQYLARLFGQLSSRGMAEKDSKNLERLTMTLFGYAQKSREEFMMVKLLATSNQHTTSLCQNTDDFMRLQAGSFQQRLLLSYARGPPHRKYLKALFGSMIKNGICSQAHLDLESDPLQIYRAILNNEELSTGRPSKRPRDLPREVVIRQEDVRPRYVEHLEDLRDLGDGFLQSLEETLHRMPYGICYVAAEQHRALCAHFPREDPAHMAVVVGSWLWKSYLLPALREPEMWGVIDRGLSPVQKRNLAQVMVMLGQVAGAGRLFGSENIYLQPLNSWITEALGRWQECLLRLFDVSSPEEHYDADQLSDLYARVKPTLYIKLVDIFTIHSLVADNIAAVAPSRDDPIKELLTDLGSAKGNETDLGGAANGSEITLTLKSRYTVQEDPNAESKALFTATKRLVLYIIRVQSGSNLMEILLRPITHEDADRWIALVQEEIAEKERESRRPKRSNSSFGRWGSIRGGRAQSVYSEAPSNFSEDRRDLLDLQSMTYAELKSTVLENILALEQPGVPPQFRVSRHSHYQELLNALAADIRQKHRRRLERQRETESTKATLAQLDAKANFLEDQLKSYNDYIEQCLHTLASKKGSKHKFIMPFTKQWSHERELERSGRQPKFGSYKYSARQLADKGVLLSWSGYAPEYWGQLNVVISSDEVGVFHLEASSGSMMIPGAAANLLLDDLLQAQYDNKNAISVFEEAGGGAKLAVNLLLHMVFKKFYRDE